MTHPTGDAQRAREEAPDLAALSEAATAGHWWARRARWPDGDVAGISAQDGDAMGDVVALNAVAWPDAILMTALVNAHRSGALLDLRSEAGRGVVDALRWYEDRAAGCRLIHSGGDADRQALDADGGKRARAALALLDAMKEDSHGG